jgi:hypothetical protein
LDRPFGDGHLERFESVSEQTEYGLAHEEMNVLGHDNVADYAEIVLGTRDFERRLEERFGSWTDQIGLSVETTEGHKMKMIFKLVTDQSPCHGRILF